MTSNRPFTLLAAAVYGAVRTNARGEAAVHSEQFASSYYASHHRWSTQSAGREAP